jgi:hypothetical protein
VLRLRYLLRNENAEKTRAENQMAFQLRKAIKCHRKLEGLLRAPPPSLIEQEDQAKTTEGR